MCSYFYVQIIYKWDFCDISGEMMQLIEFLLIVFMGDIVDTESDAESAGDIRNIINMFSLKHYISV